MEKFHRINKTIVIKYLAIQFASSNTGQVKAYEDSTSANGLPSIAQYIKKALLISDNDAYNRFYQFIGQTEINNILHKKGYKDIRITRQFMSLNEEENRHTNQVRFINEKGNLLYLQAPAYNTDSFDYSQIVKMGKEVYE